MVRPAHLVGLGFLAGMYFNSAAIAAPAREAMSALTTVGDLIFPDVKHITIGAGPQYSPDYFGSDDYEIGADLVFLVRFGKYFSGSSDGLEFNFLGMDNIQLGPTARLSGGRREGVNSALEGLGTIDISPEIGLFAKATMDKKYTLRIRLLHGVFSGHEGLTADASVGALVYQNREKDFSAFVGGKVTFIGPKYAQQFFGISPEQSESSGIGVYDINSALRDVNLNAGTYWKFKKNWSFNSFAEYSRALGSVAKSPLIKEYGSANQFKIGFNITYTFYYD